MILTPETAAHKILVAMGFTLVCDVPDNLPVIAGDGGEAAWIMLANGDAAALTSAGCDLPSDERGEVCIWVWHGPFAPTWNIGVYGYPNEYAVDGNDKAPTYIPCVGIADAICRLRDMGAAFK